MTSQHGTVAVVGSVNADLLLMVERFPGAGETVLGSGGTLSPGGKGANQAVAAARQGAEVLLVGAVGRDASAATAIALLQDSEVNLDFLASVEGPTGLAVVSVDRNAENNIVVIPGANEHVDSKTVAAALPRLRSCDVVILQGELPAATVEFVLEQLKDVPVKVLLNLAPVIPLSAKSIRAADVLIVNEHEAVKALRLLTEQPTAETDALLHAGDPVQSGMSLGMSLVTRGIAAAVVTLGARGALVAEAAGPTHVPPIAVDAVDTTGAGDAFVGALAAGLAEGMTLLEASELAVTVAAQSVTGYGAQQSYPWREGAHQPLN